MSANLVLQNLKSYYMGLDYGYRIYVKRKKLKSTMKYVFSKCDKSRSGIEFLNDKFIKLNRFHDRVERSEIKNDGLNQDLDCCLIFENDDKIWEYYLNYLCEIFHGESTDDGDYVGTYQVDENHFWIGNIEIRINDYSEIIPGLVEITFFAVTTDMSILFRDSISIDKFFKQMWMPET